MAFSAGTGPRRTYRRERRRGRAVARHAAALDPLARRGDLQGHERRRIPDDGVGVPLARHPRLGRSAAASRRLARARAGSTGRCRVTRTSVAMTSELDAQARRHLLRLDGQEDIRLATYAPSTGDRRTTAVLTDL